MRICACVCARASCRRRMQPEARFSQALLRAPPLLSPIPMYLPTPSQRRLLCCRGREEMDRAGRQEGEYSRSRRRGGKECRGRRERAPPPHPKAHPPSRHPRARPSALPAYPLHAPPANPLPPRSRLLAGTHVGSLQHVGNASLPFPCVHFVLIHLTLSLIRFVRVFVLQCSSLSSQPFLLANVSLFSCRLSSVF